ncbi:hypothetical protein M8J77_023799 [Diaphorina citri]|nr:hypothetical protein M8J77_023799 [Diaphorina citri]
MTTEEQRRTIPTEEQGEGTLKVLRILRRAYQKRLAELLDTFTTSTFSLHELQVYSKQLEVDKCKYLDIQDAIENQVDDDQMGVELQKGFAMNTILAELETHLEEMFAKHQGSDTGHEDKVFENRTPRATANLAFVPLQDDESFTNFLNRLDIFMVLKGEMDEKSKVYILLHAITQDA